MCVVRYFVNRAPGHNNQDVWSILAGVIAI